MSKSTKKIIIIAATAAIVAAAVLTVCLLADHAKNQRISSIGDESVSVTIDGNDYVYFSNEAKNSVIKFINEIKTQERYIPTEFTRDYMRCSVTTNHKDGKSETFSIYVVRDLIEGNIEFFYCIKSADGSLYKTNDNVISDFRTLLESMPTEVDYKTTYLYIMGVSEHGFVASETYVKYEGADRYFSEFQTVRVDYYESDIEEKSGTVKMPGLGADDCFEHEYKYVINKVKSIRISDYEAGEPVFDKPVIYLYPEEPTDVSVKLDFAGRLIKTIPEYRGEWTVKALPDGTLITSNGEKYPYLFWEGVPEKELSAIDCGFCVKGCETEDFLRETLAAIGLSERESADFIEYWLPRMEGNAYNLIEFRADEYTDMAKLGISPAPDSLLRVFMTYEASDCFVELAHQTFTPFERTGFAVVEWGGCEMTK